MLSDYDREIAITLVEALVEYGLIEHLAYYGDHCTETWTQETELRKADFWFSGGVTKVCIGHEDLYSWIIKVGYTENVKCDYAKREYNNYCLAKEAGLDYYFPKTYYLGEFGGRPFYIQEKVECDEDRVSSEWYERLRDDYEESGEEYDSDTLWSIIDELDNDERVFLLFNDRTLCDFLVDNHINDLHEGNFGYISDRIVIIDFSGYAG